MQVLDEPEILDKNAQVLLFSLRDPESRLYGQTKTAVFSGKTAKELKDVAKTLYTGDEGFSLELAKYFSANVKDVCDAFTWLWINEEQEVKGGKKKEKIGTLPLRQKPFQLKEGDHIGVQFTSGEKEMDWDTELDALKREERENKKQAKHANEGSPPWRAKRKASPEKEMGFNFEDEESPLP